MEKEKEERLFSVKSVFWVAVFGLLLTSGLFLREWTVPFVRRQSLSSPFAREREIQLIQLGNVPYRFEVARTDEERRQGLSNRPPLSANTGMRFVFETPDRYSFWMQEMQFPIDMIFLEKGRIVYLAKAVPYPKTPTEVPVTVRPDQPCTDVLEIPAGDADRLGLTLGQELELP